MDAFIEYMVKHKKGKKESAMIVIIILSCIAITWFLTLPLLAYSFKLPQILSTLAFALFIAVFYFAFRLIKNQNIEYEYAFTNGELDIDKIMARKKRKKLLTVSTRNFEILARVNSSIYNDFYRNLPTIDASSGNIEDTYFAVYKKDGEKKSLLFDPPKRMLDAMKPFCSSGVISN